MISTPHFSEKELIELLQKKNREAYVYLYDKYSPALYGVIIKAVRNEKIAATVLERGFKKIWEQCHSLDCIKQSLFIWMHSIVYKEIKEVAETSNEANYSQRVA